MAGLKRRVESAEDRGGKRTKVKDGPKTPRKSVSISATPSVSTKNGTLDRELKQKGDAKNRKKATKAKKAVKEEEEFDIDEDSDISDDENHNRSSTSENEDTGRNSQIDKRAASRTKQLPQATQQNNKRPDFIKSIVFSISLPVPVLTTHSYRFLS
jgi:pumilio family protein 6